MNIRVELLLINTRKIDSSFCICDKQNINTKEISEVQEKTYADDGTNNKSSKIIEQILYDIEEE